MNRPIAAIITLSATLAFAGCAGVAKDQPVSEPIVSDLDALRAHFTELAERPEHTDPSVQVQHILIGFVKPDGQTTVPGKPITRSQQEAELLTAEILGRINRGEDIGGLVSRFTDDSAPGIYGMLLSTAQPPSGGGDWFPRRGMVPAFGNVGWKLAVGQVGVANYDPSASPYGYHIIKRLK